ncbi:ABC transporter substrate-binding protein [Streptomyces roseoverticillatus]|uniref:peptide ABC transporter substrate-binding protein n=1 Tax=Streptomyces roseoverticillatus TaxID=66429 RepID=UPI001F166A4B|nr:ABC transporter substrate-binding protein [Streptomyces roseoverticillatus]MCF3102703.1 ABC transporter substrate-binding protein [Streptomyces roseoverticillatus]
MRGAKSAKWVVGAIVVAMAATACGGGSNDSGKGGGATFRLGITEPKSIDPINAQESEGTLVARQLFVGLYDVKDDGTLAPKLAESAKPNDAGDEWTFTIKKDTKFSNGEPVNAEAFIRGWTRVATKASASDVAYHMNGIAGYKELNGGSSDKFSGLSAEGDYTLKVKLSAPDFEFDKKTAHPAFSPMPKVAGAGDNKSFNDAPIGNGPFKMSGSWEHNKKITLVRNDDYGLEKAKLDKVELAILNPANGVTLEYKGFESGQFDWARMPVPQMPGAKTKYEPQGEWLKADVAGINYISPFNEVGPMKSADARKAISYAIDRAEIAKGVFQGLQEPATALLPPNFKEVYKADVCSSCVKQDKAKAKEYAEKAGLKSGDTLDFGYNTGAGHEEWVQAVAKQVEDVLGLKVKLNGLPFKEALERQQVKGTEGIWRQAWSADYPTADNFFSPLLSTNGINPDASGKALGDNRGRYSNPKFDELLVKARQTKDAAERAKIYNEAEKLAIDEDQAVIPTWKRTQYRLVNSKKFTNVKIDFYEDPNLAEIGVK